MAGDLRNRMRRRFHTVVDATELDEEQARNWVIVRALHNAYWTVEDALIVGQPIDATGRDWITRMIATAKAVQD